MLRSVEYPVRVEYMCMLSAYAIRPRGTLGMGHHFHFVKVVGHELVSLPTPALRRGIIPETRSVSYPSADRSRRTLS